MLRNQTNEERDRTNENTLVQACRNIKEALPRKFKFLSQPTRKPYNELSERRKRERITNMNEVLKWVHENVMNEILRDKFNFHVSMRIHTYREYTNEMMIEHKPNEEEEHLPSLNDQIETYMNAETSSLTHLQCKQMRSKPHLFPSFPFIIDCKKTLDNLFNINRNTKGNSFE